MREAQFLGLPTPSLGGTDNGTGGGKQPVFVYSLARVDPAFGGQSTYPSRAHVAPFRHLSGSENIQAIDLSLLDLNGFLNFAATF